MTPDPDGFPPRWFFGQNFNPVIQLGFTTQDHLPEGQRRLGAWVLPPFQRQAVWSEAQSIRFIESIWLGLPLGTYVYNAEDRPPYTYEHWLLDGQQRWRAIIRYVAGEFLVFGKYYLELSEIRHRRFMQTPFAAIETKLDDLDRLQEVYDRLAYGGTPHEAKL